MCHTPGRSHEEEVMHAEERGEREKPRWLGALGEASSYGALAEAGKREAASGGSSGLGE
jgi:hypothetical protein